MLGKQRHFYGFFMGFDLPRFCYRYVDDPAETRYTPSLYNNISVSFRAYLALAGCWENRDIFTGFLRVFTPPFLKTPKTQKWPKIGGGKGVALVRYIYRSI